MALVALGVAAPASAAPPPITLTTDLAAGKPTVGVDVDGTGHFAWKSGPNQGTQPTVNYCRVPRGASACAVKLTFTPDARESFGPVEVLIPEPGHIQLVTQRCCNEHTFVIESFDGGNTFAAAKDVGTGASESVASGPGQFAVSTLSESVGGVRFQAMPTNGGRSETHATLGDGPAGQWYPGGVGMVDPTTPIVAFSDLDNTFYRAFDPTKPPDYNNAANWRPTAPPILKEDEPDMTTGSGGTFLVTRIGTPGAFGLRARRLNGQSVLFERQKDLILDKTERDPIFHDVTADAGGGATASWIRNGCFATGNKECDSLRYSVTVDGGQSWSAPATIVDATDDNAFNLDGGTAPDHGGWVVYDGNNQGPIKAAVIPAGKGQPAGGGGGTTGTPPDGDCKTVVQINANVVAEARGGCFKSAGAKRWKATGADVRVNGIDFITGSGGSVVVDETANTVTAEGKVDQKIGAVLLNKGSLKWDLDKATKFTKLDVFDINLLGFPLTGEATAKFQKNAATVEVNLELPPPIDVATGATTLKTTQAGGLQLDGITINVPSADVGALAIKDLSVVFSAGFSTFEGKAKFLLPPTKETELQIGFGFKDGKFAHAEIPFYNGPPLPFAVYAPSVFLDAIGFGVKVDKGFRLNGDVFLSAGAGVRPIKVAGGFVFALPANKDYAELSLNGEVGVYDLALGEAHAYFNTDGLFTFNGKFGIGSDDLGIKGSVEGGLNIPASSFYASGSTSLCIVLCQTTDVIFSSIGVAACADLELVSVGFGYLWGSKFDFYFKGCDLAKYKPGGFRRLRQAGGAGTVTLKPGMPQGGIQVTGNGGIPAVSVTGPDGTTVASNPAAPAKPVVQKGILLVPDATTNTVQVVINKPAGGAWKVTPTGGAAVAKVDTADGLAETTPRGTLSGSGRRRTLAYSIAGLAGSERKVSFIERSAAGLVHMLGNAKGAQGKLPFAVEDGPAGKRTVEAIVVDSDGLALDTVVLDRFTAPGPSKPSRPSSLRITRSGGKAKITWGRASGARAYKILVKLTDGRTLQLTSKRRTVTVRSIEKTDRIRVAVRGVSKLGKRGRAASKTLLPGRSRV